MTREEALEEMKKAKKILVTLKDWGYSREYKSYFPYLMVWVITENDKIYPIHCEESGYYSKRKNAYGMRVWGTDRVLELIKSIAGYENCYKGLKLMDKVISLL
jgi:hypothetical protein